MTSGSAAPLTIRVPFKLKHRGGRKLIIVPDGSSPLSSSPSQNEEPSLVKAVGRAFRWRKLLESGQYATIQEIADGERVNPSYVSRILRLTLLAPELVDAILSGRPPDSLSLATGMKPFPLIWEEQHKHFAATNAG